MADITKYDLVYSLRELTLSLKKEWKNLSKKNGAVTRDEIIGFRDGALLSTLEKIALLGGNAIRLDKHSEFTETLKLLANVYEAAGEVDRFGFRGGEEHLSWTLPSRLAFEHIYILGGLAVKHKNLNALSNILGYKIEYPNKYPYENAAGRSVFLMSHPFFSSESSEGDLRTYFDHTKKIIIDNKVFFDWFDEDQEQVTDALVHFDFMRGFYLSLNDHSEWVYHNFRRFYTFRVMPMIRRLVTNPEYKGVFGNDIKPNLIKFLERVDKQRTDTFEGWGFGSWRDMPELELKE